jgi:hypothetical protein
MWRIPPVSDELDNLDMSVLIPTYNRAEIWEETLEVLCQVEQDVAIVRPPRKLP